MSAWKSLQEIQRQQNHIMENPIAPRIRKPQEPKPYDPLSTGDTAYDRYDWYRKH